MTTLFTLELRELRSNSPITVQIGSLLAKAIDGAWYFDRCPINLPQHHVMMLGWTHWAPSPPVQPVEQEVAR